jgi:hypothetical protein
VSDHVRVRDVSELRALGLAGRTGVVLGQSIPSITGVPVSGPAPDDYVEYVFFDGDDSDDTVGGSGVWIAPEFLELDTSKYTSEELAARTEAHRQRREREQSEEAQLRALDLPAERSPNDFLGRWLDRIWPD